MLQALDSSTRALQSLLEVAQNCQSGSITFSGIDGVTISGIQMAYSALEDQFLAQDCQVATTFTENFGQFLLDDGSNSPQCLSFHMSTTRVSVSFLDNTMVGDGVLTADTIDFNYISMIYDSNHADEIKVNMNIKLTLSGGEDIIQYQGGFPIFYNFNPSEDWIDLTYFPDLAHIDHLYYQNDTSNLIKIYDSTNKTYLTLYSISENNTIGNLNLILQKAECHEKCSRCTPNECIPCRTCSTCDRLRCYLCNDPYYLEEFLCVEQCDVGRTLYNNTFQQVECFECHLVPYCKTCYMDNACIECQEGYRVFFSVCIEIPREEIIDNATDAMVTLSESGECQVGLYHDNTLNMCITCGLDCGDCNNEICLQCNLGYFLIKDISSWNCVLDFMLGFDLSKVSSVEIDSAWCPNSGIMINKEGQIQVVECKDEIISNIEAYAKTNVFNKIIEPTKQGYMNILELSGKLQTELKNEIIESIQQAKEIIDISKVQAIQWLKKVKSFKKLAGPVTKTIQRKFFSIFQAANNLQDFNKLEDKLFFYCISMMLFDDGFKCGNQYCDLNSIFDLLKDKTKRFQLKDIDLDTIGYKLSQVLDTNSILKELRRYTKKYRFIVEVVTQQNGNIRYKIEYYYITHIKLIQGEYIIYYSNPMDYNGKDLYMNVNKFETLINSRENYYGQYISKVFQYEKEKLNRNIEYLKGAYDFLSGMPFYVGYAQFKNSMNEKKAYLIKQWKQEVEGGLKMRLNDYANDLDLDGIQIDDYYLDSIEIFAHKAYDLMDSQQLSFNNCTEFTSQILPLSNGKYCNYVEKQSICFEIEFESNNHLIQDICSEFTENQACSKTECFSLLDSKITQIENQIKSRILSFSRSISVNDGRYCALVSIAHILGTNIFNSISNEVSEFLDKDDYTSAFSVFAFDESFINLYPSSYTSLMMSFITNKLIVSGTQQIAPSDCSKNRRLQSSQQSDSYYFNNCENGKCKHQQICPNYEFKQSVQTYCEKGNELIGWDVTCCTCLANQLSGGDVNGQFYTKDSKIHVGLLPISNADWKFCGHENEIELCNYEANMICAMKLYSRLKLKKNQKYNGFSYWNPSSDCQCPTEIQQPNLVNIKAYEKNLKEFSMRLVNFIKSVEGFRAEKYVPPEEKGKDTITYAIGYGHMLYTTIEQQTYNGIITEEQATSLLIRDLDNTYVDRTRKIFDEWIKKEGSFDSLPQIRREMLIDFGYNLSNNMKQFKKFMTAVFNNDKDKIKQECIRSYLDPVTNARKELKDRNEKFINTFLGDEYQ